MRKECIFDQFFSFFSARWSLTEGSLSVEVFNFQTLVSIFGVLTRIHLNCAKQKRVLQWMGLIVAETSGEFKQTNVTETSGEFKQTNVIWP